MDSIANNLLIIFSIMYSNTEKIDINNSEINQLLSIPINKEKIILVYDYIQMYGSLKSIYDVLYIPEIESSDLETLKKYIIILN